MIFDFRFMLLVLLMMNWMRRFIGSVLLLVLSLYAGAQDTYRLHYTFVDKDTSLKGETLGLQTAFANQANCRQYIGQAINKLHAKGYITASADSAVFDSASAQVWLYIGRAYRWIELNTDSADKKMLASIGWRDNTFMDDPLSFTKVHYWQERMLDYYENNGYPFARVALDSLTIHNDEVFGKLKTDKGTPYKIDSIRVYGKAKISNYFLQRYLGIENGSLYKKARLQSVSQRLLELPYLREVKTWDMTMTGSGSVLNLYLDPKKSSQVDVIVGFLPASNESGRTKFQLTGEANINLKNALGSGETIGVNWQQIQLKSPRLHLQYEHPYVFNTPFGLDFNFDLLKKDSLYLNLNAQFGVQYLTSGTQSGKVFFQTFFTNVLPGGIDTAQVRATKKLPPYIDVSANNVGVQYKYNNTDYRFNPRKGNELMIIGSAGLRKIKPNTAITNMQKDPSGDPFDYASLYDTLEMRTYLLKINLSGAHYFKTGQQSAFKAALNAGWLYTHDIFRNEMFQIGGYKLLRGFDEESIYASSYSVLTLEYRFFIGLNSFFFGFADGGWVQNKAFDESPPQNAHSYIGLGIGMAFETKAGIFNLSYATGKRDDMPFDLKQSKIHFGLISLF